MSKNAANDPFRSVVVGFSLPYVAAVVYFYSVWLIPYEGAEANGYANAAQ